MLTPAVQLLNWFALTEVVVHIDYGKAAIKRLLVPISAFIHDALLMSARGSLSFWHRYRSSLPGTQLVGTPAPARFLLSIHLLPYRITCHVAVLQ